METKSVMEQIRETQKCKPIPADVRGKITKLLQKQMKPSVRILKYLKRALELEG
jgi:hypothetical protein